MSAGIKQQKLLDNIMTSLPDKIGKYQICSILGQGGMGIVYKAIDPDISQEVALKVIRPELLKNDTDGTFLKRFRNEVLACRRLKHPNIVATYDYHEEGFNCFIVMEYVDGQPLSDFLDTKQVFDFSHIYKIIKQLLSVLSYAHGQGVIHRDIKPDNILVKDDGFIHVMDFGIARMDTSTLTVAGTVMGSPGYMSPEQCMGKQVDQRSDIFSAGVVLYQLITNEKPFTGDNPMATMQKILNVEPVKVSLLNNNIPSSFDLVINKALAKTPKSRYQSAEEFLEDIEDFYEHYLKPHEISTKNKSVILIAGLLLIGAAAGGAYFFKDNLGLDGPVSAEENEQAKIVEKTDKIKVTEQVAELPVEPNTEDSRLAVIESLNKAFKNFECNTLRVEKDPVQNLSITGSVLSSDFNKFNDKIDGILSNVQYSSVVEKIDKPFCDILLMLDQAVELNQANNAELSVLPYSHSKTYFEGELIKFEVITPSDQVYVYVDYFTSDGNVVHIYPSSEKENKLVKGPTNFILGDKEVKWEVAGPFGKDLIIISSYPKPIFKPVRNNFESSQEYIRVFKNKIASLDQNLFKANYFFLTTQAKN